MPDQRTSPAQLFLIFVRLGLTSFGGPVAHLGYFQNEFVARRRWFTDHAYADLVALSQFLPGPASSQVVMGIGATRAGIPGAVAASLGFTLPSLLLMIGFGYAVLGLGGDLADKAWIHALKVVAAAVVAQAVWTLGRTLCTDRVRSSIALAAAAFLLLWPISGGQLIVIAGGAVLGWRLCKADPPAGQGALPVTIGRATAVWLLAAFFLLLGMALLLPSGLSGDHGLELFNAMYRSGALVFGGGHVVLPLLEAETVRTGWVDRDLFLAGYGAAQAIPGPLFTFAGFLGTVQTSAPNGVLGGLIATTGIFLAPLLVLLGTLPFWLSLRQMPAARAALAGVNAAVVGLLLAALYDPVITSAIHDGRDLALALLAFALLELWKVPAWVVVIGAGVGAALLT